MSFEDKFNQWLELVIDHDPQQYQDMNWDWQDELMKFKEDSDEALIAAKKNFCVVDSEIENE